MEDSKADVDKLAASCPEGVADTLSSADVSMKDVASGDETIDDEICVECTEVADDVVTLSTDDDGVFDVESSDASTVFFCDEV